MSGTTVASLRQENLSRALHVLHARRSLTRAELTAALGTSRNTTAQIVSDLVARGFLEEDQAPASGRRGRPTTVLRAGPGSAVALVAEISPAAIRTGVVTLARTIADLREEPLPLTAGFADPVLAAERLQAALTGLLAAYKSRCAGVAVALYGLVRADGHVKVAPNLGWSDVPLQAWLTPTLPTGMPLLIGNDASFAAVHEARYGAGIGARTCLYLYATTGVGGGLTVDGRLVGGRHGYAGEIGHMLINPAGIRCRCGRIGCWETEVDRAALHRRASGTSAGAAGSTLGYVTGAQDDAAAAAVLTAHAAGSPAATVAVLETARWLGEGLGSLLNVLDPDRVILAGALSELFTAVPDTVLEHTARRQLAHEADLAHLVVISTDQRDAALLGAAEPILQPILEQPDTYQLRSPTGRTIPAGSQARIRHYRSDQQT